MPFKIVIGEKTGKSWKIEMESDYLMGKNIGDKVNGKEIKEDFEGYEFEIKGGSDHAGFPLSKDVEGLAYKRLLLTKGFGMRESGGGLRKRKAVRGKIISNTTSQLNLAVVKEGKKKLSEIFADQNKPAVKEEKKVETAVAPAA